jgi:drug/metabolite transporter (DMT)-like permease
VLAALSAALLFGVSPALGKLAHLDSRPLLGTALLYGGAGLGVGAWWLLTALGSRLRARPKRNLPQRTPPSGSSAARPPRGSSTSLQLAATVVFGGTGAPLLLLWGLGRLDASIAALLLNLEMPLTVLVATLVFGQRLGRSIWPPVALTSAGAAWLVWAQQAPATALTRPPSVAGALAVAAACGCWALDTNVSQRLAASASPRLLVVLKGLGAVVLTVPLWWYTDGSWPPVAHVLQGLAVGAACYGASMVLFIYSLRELGTAATAGLFALAPFLGSSAALALERRLPNLPLLGAGLLMALGARRVLSVATASGPRGART